MLNLAQLAALIALQLLVGSCLSGGCSCAGASKLRLHFGKLNAVSSVSKVAATKSPTSVSHSAQLFVYARAELSLLIQLSEKQAT